VSLKKEEILRIDRKHIWHPFTQMKDYENQDPKVICQAQGIHLYDMDGNHYYDTISSWWTNSLGHRNKRIIKAIKKQLKKIEHVNFSGFTHPYAAELVKMLTAILPQSLSRFFFSDNGSTAVEVALKMAFQYYQNLGSQNKTKFVMFANAYHGDTIGSVSVGGVDLYHKIYQPLLFKSFMSPGPNCSSCPHRKSDFTYDANNTGCQIECFQQTEKLLTEHHQSIAGVIIEPLLQGAGGMYVYPALFLKKLRHLTEKLGVLLIYDEVATGFGRTGTLFAMDQTETVPDFICLSKALTAGYLPMALTVTTEKVYQAYYDDYFSYKTFFHGHSYTAYPLACAAAIENLKILKKDRLPFSRQSVLQNFHQGLKNFAHKDYIQDIRYLGFVGAIDLVQSRAKNKSYETQVRIGQQIYLESLNHGLVLRPLGDTLYWFLPLIVSEKDVKNILKISTQVIESVIKRNQ